MSRPTVFCSESAVQLRVRLCSVSQRAEEAGGSPLLRFVTRKRPVETLQRNAIVESCYQVKTSESRLGRLEYGAICSVEISSSVRVIRSYDV
jgi:hypothetical protein